MFFKFFANAQSLHIFGPGNLEQTADDEVTAIWGTEDQIIVNGSAGLVEMRGGGYYFETWKKVGDDWLLGVITPREDISENQLSGEVHYVS
jgi:hypothetical protein